MVMEMKEIKSDKGIDGNSDDEKACDGITNIFIGAFEHKDKDDGFAWMINNGTLEKSGQGVNGTSW